MINSLMPRFPYRLGAATTIVLALLGHTRAETPRLIGHWILDSAATTDATDRVLDRAGPHHGQSRHVVFGRQGATFDGRLSVIEIPHRDSLQLGTDPFSIALWVNTAAELDDGLGDLVSKYDPKTRTGFNFGIQCHAGVTSSQANLRHIHFGIDSGSANHAWTDHGRLGEAVLVFAMAVYQGQLFAGTCEAGPQQAGRVFRFDGTAWTACGAPDKCNAVSSLAVYQGHLYAAVSRYRLAGSALAESDNPHLGGRVYRYDGDHEWTDCGTLPAAEAINGMVVYRGKLYASSMYAPAGFFRYEGGTSWTACPTPAGKRVEALTVHDGFIYATGYDEGAVYRYDGNAWEHLGVLEGASQTYGFATHHGELYVSEWPHARVFRLASDGDWIPAGRLGEEMESMPLMVYNGKMYGGTLPSAEVYRFDDPAWTKVARLDFTPDVRYRRVWTMSVYRGRLFAGTLPSGRVHSVEIGRNVTCDRALPTGWVHLAAVRDADQLRLHVNGERVASSAKFEPGEFHLANERPLQIGFGAHDHLCGKLKDVRLYRGTLSKAALACLATSNEPTPSQLDEQGQMSIPTAIRAVAA